MLNRRQFLVALLLLACRTASAEELRGLIIKVQDGDTVTLQLQDRIVRVQLEDIDAPEIRQPYGDQARQAMIDVALWQEAVVLVSGEDRYGRTLGRLMIAGLDANFAMVRMGATWIFRRFTDDPAMLAAEEEARAAGRGLWALPAAQQIPPWEWRQGRR